jgi:hypothetical protein
MPRTPTVAASLALAVLVGCSADQPPTHEEAHAAVADYLRAEKARTCKGSVTLESLRIARVEPYSSQWKGFPAYAAFRVSCREGNLTTTWEDSDTARAMVAVLRRRSFGGWEAFMPEFFREAQRMLEQQLNEAFNRGTR